MENLLIKTGYPLSKRIVFGGGLILVAVIMLILNITLEIKFLAGSMIPFFLIGVLFLTPLSSKLGLGSYKTQVKVGKGFLEIKWPDRDKINVLEYEIDRITLSTKYVFIFRKARKDIKLVLYDKNQKTQVFKFLTEYAKEKNLTLINQDEQKS
jgi:hypothetical protein